MCLSSHVSLYQYIIMYCTSILIMDQVGLCVFELTGSATPAGDVTEVPVGQDLSGGGQGSQLDLGVESSLRGQAQESDVPPEKHRKELDSWNPQGSFIIDICTVPRCT